MSGDPNCSSTRGGFADRERERIREEELRKQIEAIKSATPDAERFEVVDMERVDRHVVLKVLYPNCQKCSYEGLKILVFLNVTEKDVVRWRRIDPHFRDPKVKLTIREAPSPAARFPATTEGWSDAIEFAQRKK